MYGFTFPFSGLHGPWILGVHFSRQEKSGNLPKKKPCFSTGNILKLNNLAGVSMIF